MRDLALLGWLVSPIPWIGCTQRWCPGEDSNLHALASAST
ncbi:MAG: hypothetical protein QOD54_786, partial [Sphingomonadales bacterium]|nr:hypothetical protein [Sphingomonadales bacterium]